MAHLDDTVAGVKGIGPKKQKLLAGMGIHTLRDVLTLYPFRYDDWSELAPVREWRGRDTAVFVGRVTHLDVANTSRRNVKVVKAVLEGAQGEIVATWFGRYQMEKYLYPGVQLLVFGRVSANYSMELNVQEHQFIKNEAQLRRPRRSGRARRAPHAGAGRALRSPRLSRRRAPHPPAAEHGRCRARLP